MDMTERTMTFVADKTSRHIPWRRIAGKKSSALFGLALAGWMLSTSVQAAACRSDSGTQRYDFLMDYTLKDPSENVAGRTINGAYQWSLGSTYLVSCDCTKPYGPAWITAKVPERELVHTDGKLKFYAINDYLAVASEVWIAGERREMVATPFSGEINKNPEVRCKSFLYSTGSKGNISLYFRRPFVGEQIIPVTKVTDVYIATDKMTQSSEPVSTVWMSGKVTVPQSCVINGGGTIDVPFGDIMAGDITTKGEMAKNFTPHNVNLNVKCSNISEGVKVSLSFSGTPDMNDPTALSTTNKDVGVRMKDSKGDNLDPNGGELPLNMDYTSQIATSSITLFPFNTTGKMPETGDFTATATIRAEIQ
ncbi:fimbrial protein [Leclercia sp. W17]|nr:fimbrial protein [Leclercia sp. W17]